ncbi:AIPR family protein [Bradyrhizobium barranii]
MSSQPQRILTIEEEKATEFGKRLDVEVSDRLTGNSPSEDEVQAAFAEVAGAYIVQDGGMPEFVPCSINEKVGRNRVTVRGYSPIDDAGTLRLVTTAYRDDGGALGSSEFDSLVRFASSLVTAVEAGRELDERPEVVELVKHIRDEGEALREVRVIVVSNLRINADDLEAESGSRRYRSEQYDIDRLYRISDMTIRRSDIQLDFRKLIGRGVPCLEVSGKDYNYKTYLMTLDGETLYKIFERYGSKLYELNLRSYLQPKTSVNKKMLETIKTTPVRFLAYNNGICATADDIDAGLEHGQTVIRKLVGFQIVNGAQTTSTIHRARKAGDDVSQIHVSVKLTRVDGADLEEFIPRITEYANTQNPIKAADLQSNIKFHRSVELLSESTWCPDGDSRWFYERARGAYEAAYLRYGTTPKKKREFREECPKSQKFGKTELAMDLVAWKGEPQKVCLGAQKNFNYFMNKLDEFVPAGQEPDGKFYRDAVSVGIVYDSAARAVRKAAIPAYRAQITAYLVARCAAEFGEAFRLDRVWSEQEITDELFELMVDWSLAIQKSIIASANGQNVTEWCKKDGCWEEVRTVKLEMKAVPPEALPEDKDPLFSITPAPLKEAPVDRVENDTSGDEIRVSSLDDVELCRRLNEYAWVKIAQWGAETRTLSDFERKIVATMQQMAVGGWHRDPSPKQAKHAGRIARRAIDRDVVRPA